MLADLTVCSGKLIIRGSPAVTAGGIALPPAVCFVDERQRFLHLIVLADSGNLQQRLTVILNMGWVLHFLWKDKIFTLDWHDMKMTNVFILGENAGAFFFPSYI